jgi:hypothetical protein
MEPYPMDQEGGPQQQFVNVSRMFSEFGVDCNAYGVRNAFKMLTNTSSTCGQASIAKMLITP